MQLYTRQNYLQTGHRNDIGFHSGESTMTSRSSNNRRDSRSAINKHIPTHAVARNSVLIFGMQIVTKILGLVSAILLANYLNTQLFGKYNYAFALSSLFIPLCDLGMDTFLIREVARGSASAIGDRVNSVLSGKLILTLCNFFLVAIVAGIIEDFGSAYWILILFGAAVTFFRTYWTTFSSVFRAINQVMYDVSLYSLARVGEFISVIITITTQRSLIFLLISLGIVNLLAIGLTFAILHKRFIHVAINTTLAQIRVSLRGGFPFALTTIFSAIYFNLDTVFIKNFVNESAAGIYRAAYNLILPLMMVTISITGAVFPFVSQNFQTHREQVQKIVRESGSYLLIIALPGAIAGMFLAKDVIGWLYAPVYADSAQSLTILVWFLPIVYMTNLFANVLGAIDDQPFVLKITALNVVVNITANLLLIPTYGQIGAAIVIVLTEFVSLVFLSYRIHAKVGRTFSLTRFLRTCLACCVLLVYLLWFRIPVSILPTLGILFLIYAVSIFIFRALTIQEIRQLITLMKNKQTSVKD
jgi:O-antigen/teichoic acid export membrane protein